VENAASVVWSLHRKISTVSPTRLVTSRHNHERSEKVAFYKNLCEELEQACGISPSDVVVTISDISDDGTATAEIDNAALEKES
jgi:Tautomerase enzyme